MTEPKTLSPQEALRALADGKKLSLPGWVGKYINLNGDAICYGGGAVVSFTSYDGFIEYTEPKPKRKVAPYYVHPEGCNTFLTADCYETEEEAKKIYAKACSVTRCTALEIEVEIEA